MLIKNGGHPELAKFNNLLGLGPGDTLENEGKDKKEHLNSVSSAGSLINNSGNPDEKKEVRIATSSSKASVS